MSEPADRRAIRVMADEIGRIPEVIASQVAMVRDPIRDLVGRLTMDPPPEVVLTGCGDSFYAGIGAVLALQRDAGVRTHAIEALELARYQVRYVPSRPRPPLLVALSYSGEVGRTVEAAAAATDAGWDVASLTGRGASRLARATEPIVLDVPTLGFSPGTSTYIAMLCGLYCLAAELARANGRRREAARADRALGQAPELAEKTLALCASPAHEFARIMAAGEVTTFLGAGPHRAAAAFGAAKLFEAAQRQATAQDLEEWAHEQYFVSAGGRTPVAMVAPTGASRDRAGELLDEMRFIGLPSAFVTDVVDDPIARCATLILPIAPGSDEAYSPLLTCLPLAIAGYELAALLGRSAYGFPSHDHEVEHYETIHREARGTPA